MSEIYICRHDRLINFCAHCQAELEGYSTTASTGEQTKPRRVVQISNTSTVDNDIDQHFTVTTALMSDGSIYEYSRGSWEKLPSIPQDEGEK